MNSINLPVYGDRPGNINIEEIKKQEKSRSLSQDIQPSNYMQGNFLFDHIKRADDSHQMTSH